MTIKDRLIQFLRAEGISNSEFSRRMSLSPAYIGSMRKSMPEEKVERLCEIFPRLNRDWLLYGQGEMYADVKADGSAPKKRDVYRVPLLPVTANAGRLGGFSEGILMKDCQQIPSPELDATLAIKVDGDSMEPDIPEGYTLFLSPMDNPSFIPWGHPYVITTHNGVLLKELYPSSRGDRFLEARSVNPKYLPFDIPKEEIINIYRVLCQLRTRAVM